MTNRRSQRLQQKREAAAPQPGSVDAVPASPGSIPSPQAGSDASGSSGIITGAPPGNVTVASPESVATPQTRSVASYQLRSAANPRGATAPPSAGMSRAKEKSANQRKKLMPVIRPTRPRGRPPGRIEKLPIFGPRRPRGRPPGPKIVPPPPGPEIAPPPPPKAAFKRTLEVMKSVLQCAILVPLAYVIGNSTIKNYLY